MGSLSNEKENIVDAAEAGAINGGHLNLVPSTSFASELAMDNNNTTTTTDIDDKKTPPVFGRLWREIASIFTLACAPGLNVFPLFTKRWLTFRP